MCGTGRLIAHCQGSKDGDGGAGDRDDRGLAAGRAAHVSGEVGP